MEDTFYRIWPKEEMDSMTSSWITDFSNAVEGIYVDWAGAHKEGEKIEFEEFHVDHVKALDYVIENYFRPPDKNDLLYLHMMLCERIAPDIAGQIRSSQNFIHSRGTFVVGNPLPEHVEPLLDDLFSRWNAESTLDGILKNHYELMTIHPFTDGNGRTGRLLLNWQTMRQLGFLVSIVPSKIPEYYSAIRSYRDDFTKVHPEVEFTTYASLDKETKKRLEKLRRKKARDDVAYRKKLQKALCGDES